MLTPEHRFVTSRRSRVRLVAVLLALAALILTASATVNVGAAVRGGGGNSETAPLRQFVPDHAEAPPQAPVPSGCADQASCAPARPVAPAPAQVDTGAPAVAEPDAAAVTDPSGTVAQRPAEGVPGTRITATYRTLSTRSGSYRGRVTLVNEAPTSGAWKLELRLPPEVAVTWSSGGTFTQNGQTVTFSWPSPLDAGANLTVEFEANKVGQNLADFVPKSCSVNGNACA